MDTTEPNHHGFPGACLTKAGRLFVCWRQSTQHESQGQSAITVARYSDDRGVTWSDEQTIIGTGTQYEARGACLTALSNNQILCAYILKDWTVPPAGETGPDSGRVIRSTDNGETWSEPVTVETEFTSYAAATSPIVELPDRTLVWSLYGYTSGAGGNSWCVIVKSTDHGYTWTQTGTLQPNNGNINTEPQLVLLADGRLMGLVRVESVPDGKQMIWRAWSEDSGETWTPTQPVFAGHGAPRACCLRNSKLLAISRGTVGYGLPLDRVVGWTSLDDGISWQGPFLIDDTVYNEDVYATPVPLGGSQVGIAYGVELVFHEDAYCRWKTVRVR